MTESSRAAASERVLHRFPEIKGLPKDPPSRAQAEVRRLYWYQDGLLIGSTTPEDRLMLEPRPGPHRLVVTDDRGRSSG